MKIWRTPRMLGARFGIVLMLAGVMGCGPKDELFHGSAPSANGAWLDIASLMPSCGCMTVHNLATDAPIELVSSLHTTELGTHRLNANQETRVGFDWGGPDNDDSYTLEAYRLEPDGRGGMARAKTPLTPIFDFVETSAITDVDCKKMDCPFGTLAMDRVINSPTAGGQPVIRRTGVDYASDGQQISAASSPNSCGCMLLSNISPDKQAVTLRSTFHASNEGSMEIAWDPAATRQAVALVGFDWAGTEEEDRYLLSAIGANDGTALKNDRSTRQLRVQDFVQIVGRMDQLECSAEGAVLRLPAPAGMPIAPGETAPPTQIAVTCPFGSLSMNEQIGKIVAPRGLQR
jgi:hypothetical protein